MYVDFNDEAEAFGRLGFDSCTRFCEDMLAVEHTALLPGSALLLPESDYSVRMSFVDYDGDRALSAWRSGPARQDLTGERFLEENCPLIVDGIGSIGRYIEAVREGRRPEHFDAPAGAGPA